MDQEQAQLIDNRGRVIAHVFYSELEKIAKVHTMAERTVSNLGKNLRALGAEQANTRAGTGWFRRNIASRFGDKKGIAGAGELKQSKLQTSAVKDELKKRRAAANELRTSPNAKDRELGRKQLEEINAALRGAKTPKGKGNLPVDGAATKPGAGASDTQFGRLAKNVGTAAILGGGAYAGYKGYKAMKPSDPYAQYV